MFQQQAHSNSLILLLLSLTTTVGMGGAIISLHHAHADITGEDDRQEISLAENLYPELRLKELSQAISVQISPDDLVGGDEAVRPDQPLAWVNKTLESRFGFCSTARFAQQPANGRCTGVLVTEQMLLTAAHCLTTQAGASDQSPCDAARFVFDYRYEGKSLRAKGKDLYRCKQVIPLAPSDPLKKPRIGEGELLDYAMVILDRKVEGRKPVTIAAGAKVRSNARWFAIGHPYGLPQKFIGKGRATQAQSNYWLSNLDASEGTSGGPVFDVETRQLIGIFKGVTYPQDFLKRVHDTPTGCRRYYRFGAKDFRTVVISSSRAEGLLEARPSDPQSLGDIPQAQRSRSSI